jgi:hypothetical protein
MVHVASIVHLTDLHLSVLRDGQERSPDQRKRLEHLAMAALGRIKSGVATASPLRLRELIDFLPQIVRVEGEGGAPVVVVQTGDVEAHGHVDPDPYGSFHYLHDHVWPRLRAQGATCIDLYGNHDIWPGHPPLPGSTHDARRLQALSAFQQPWAGPVLVPANQLDLAFHRLNTVVTGRFTGGILARGGIGPHPPDVPYEPAHVEAVLTDVLARVGDTSRRRLHVILCHHPPHSFRSGWFTEWTSGYLQGREHFARLTPDRVALIIAGHRHALDPVASLDCSRGKQPPVASGAGQLVSESPTQRDRNPNSLSVYRLHYASDRDMIAVERLLFAAPKHTGLQRRPDEQRSDVVLHNLRIGG